jgi:putative ABC transport system permease protein
MANILDEVRFSIRLLARNRGQSVIIIGTLALAIAAFTSVLALVTAILLKSYGPVNADQWVYLWEKRLKSNSESQLSVSAPNFLDWKRDSTSVFSDMVIWLPWSYTASGVGVANPEQLRAAVILPEVFPAARIVPAAGRLLLPSDSARSERVVMLSHAFWMRAYGGDASVVGKQIRLNLVPHTVVGIAPPGFSFPPEQDVDAWTSLPAAALSAGDRAGRGYRAAAKLKPGVSPQMAESALNVVARRLAAQYPEDHEYGVEVVPMRSAVVGDFRTPVIALSGALAFALALVCLNISYLRAVYLESRRKEMMLRLAIGATSKMLVRQLLVETAILFCIGGAIGLWLSPVGVRLLLALAPPSEISWLHAGVDPVILLSGFALTFVCAAISGLAPALRAARSEPARALGSGGSITNNAVTHTSIFGRSFRSLVLIAQIGLAFIPLCGASLLVRSFQRLQEVPSGFDPRQRLTLMLSLPRARYAGDTEIAALSQRIGREARQLSGMEAAGIVQTLPFAPGPRWMQAVATSDPKGVRNLSELPLARYTVATAGYLEAMGISLNAGRMLADSDDRHSQPVLVVNEKFARDYFGTENPIGKRIWVGHGESLPGSGPRVIVGVVADIRLDRLERSPDASVWAPISQQEGSDAILRNLYLVVHTNLATAAALPAIRELIRNIDADLALSEVETMDGRLRESLWRQRLSAIVVEALSIAALGIAMLGVFGITSYLVACRTHEIGLRIALGATPAGVLRMILVKSLLTSVSGAAIGLAGAAASTRVLSTFLYGVTATDPLTFGGVAVALVISAVAASYIPARRASVVDPIVAIRQGSNG